MRPQRLDPLTISLDSVGGNYASTEMAEPLMPKRVKMLREMVDDIAQVKAALVAAQARYTQALCGLLQKT